MRLFAITLASLLLLAPNAHAEYLSIFGGAEFQDSFSGDGKASMKVDHDPGYVVGAAFGDKLGFLPGFRAEVEVAYRSSGLDGVWNGCSEFALTGNDSTFSAMANLIRDLELGNGFSAYALAGAGIGARRLSLEPNPWSLSGGGADERGFVWQVGAGLEYDLAPGWKAGLGYRYFDGVDMDRVAKLGWESSFFEADGDSHNVLLTLRHEL